MHSLYTYDIAKEQIRISYSIKRNEFEGYGKVGNSKMFLNTCQSNINWKLNDNEAKALLAALSHVASCDYTAALVQNNTVGILH